MFARIASGGQGWRADLEEGVNGHPHHSSEGGAPANAWIWGQQSILTQRRLLECPPLKAPSSTGRSPVVCQAVKPKCSSSSKLLRRARKQGSLGSAGLFRAPSQGPLSYQCHPSTNTTACGAATATVAAGLPASTTTNTTSSSSRSPPSPEDISCRLRAAGSFRELQALCDACLASEAFSSSHACLALQRLPQLASQAGGEGQLLLVERLVAKLGGRLNYLPAPDIAIVTWVLAKVGYQCDPLLLQQAVGAFLAKLKKQLAPAALVTLAVGLAGLGFSDAGAWRRLLAAARRLLPSLSTAALQQLVWACATAQQQGAEGFCAELADACLEQLEGFQVEELVTLAWCLDSLGYRDKQLYQAVARRMVQCLQERGKPLPSSSSSGGGGISVVGSAGSSSRGRAEGGQPSSSSNGATSSSEGSSSCSSSSNGASSSTRGSHPAGWALSSPQHQQLGEEDLPVDWGLQLPEQLHCGRRGSAAAAGKTGTLQALVAYDPFLAIMVLHRDFLQGGWVG